MSEREHHTNTHTNMHVANKELSKADLSLWLVSLAYEVYAFPPWLPL